MLTIWNKKTHTFVCFLTGKFRMEIAPMNILFCCNPEYFQHLSVAIVSLLDNNKAANITIHVMCSRKDEQLEKKVLKSLVSYCNYSIHFHEFQLAKYRSFFIGNTYITSETYLRIFAAKVLPNNIEKILYLDADLVVLGDLLPLWNLCLDDHVLAAVKDPYGDFRRNQLSMPCKFSYVNAGVLLIDLKRWRSLKVTSKLVKFIESNTNNLVFHDQDAINAVLYSKIQLISYRWNLQAKMFRSISYLNVEDQKQIYSARDNPAIVHYSSALKPWIFSVWVVPKSTLYYKYLDQTEWKGTPKENFSWIKCPEFCFYHLLYWCGFDFAFLEKYDNAMMRALRRILRSTIGFARLLHEHWEKKRSTSNSSA